jgi:hypothetical protein
MKKIIGLLIVGLTVLLLLSFMPSNTLNQEITSGSDNSYLTLVPAKPPVRPPQK